MRFLSKFGFSTFLLMGCVFIGNAQEKFRTVDESDPALTYKNTPVAIVRREFRGKPFSKGERLQGSKHWLPEVTLVMKNKSAKTIVYLYVDLVIEKQGKMSATTKLSIPLSFGNPRVPLEKISPDGKRTNSIRTGDIVRLSVSEASMAYWKEYLAENDAEDFDRVAVDIRYVHYDDGTGWTMGFETRQDPDDPSKWKIVNPNKRSPISNFHRWFSRWISIIVTPSGSPGSPLLLTTLGPAISGLKIEGV